jgi:hypothetical protein
MFATLHLQCTEEGRKTFILLALACALLGGCGDTPEDRAAKNSFVIEPQGSEREIAEACGRASFAMTIFTLDKFSPAESYLDPSGAPGYDPQRKDHNQRAAKHLANELQAVNRQHLGDADKWFERSIKELGWKVVAENKVEAGEFAWSNLERRVDWCFDHVKVSPVLQAAVAMPAQPLAQPVALAVDPYRTKIHPGKDGADPIVIEYQPD